MTETCVALKEKLLTGKNAVITGAKGGLGRAFVKMFAEHGANVWACIRKPDEDFASFSEQIAKENSVWIKTICFDMENEEEVKRGASEIVAEKQSIDILINNAGVSSTGMLLMTSMQELHKVFQINYFSQVYLTQRLLKSMIRQNGGSIINICSVAALYHQAGRLSYGSSKASLLWFSEMLAQEVGAYNIRSNAICPGVTDTPMIQFHDKIVSQSIADRVANTAMGRAGRPEEVADAAVFLASDKSSYITGATIRIDGGGGMATGCSQNDVTRIEEMTKRMRLAALDMAYSTGKAGSHIGGGFSCMEIFAVLYGAVMNVDAKNPYNPDRDRFLTSKAHCILAQYTALCEKGFITAEERDGCFQNASRLTGYPLAVGAGLEYSGGSLGMALPVAIGIALALKERKSPAKIYVLLGDGDLHEGSNWEAIMSASHFKLDNLCAVVDRNHLSYDGNTEDVMALGNLSEKFKSFNWNVLECNGHNVGLLLNAFSGLKTEIPNVVIADTIKGKGLSFAENQPEWHHHSLTQEQYELGKSEILAGDAV